MKSAGKARNNGLYRHIRTSKEIIRNLLNDYIIFSTNYCKNMTKLCKDIEIHQGLDIIRNIRYSEVNKRE